LDEGYTFGPFELRAVPRTLTRGGEPVVLGSRAVDILLFLVANAGRLLTNAEIVKHAWPDTYVDDTNLRVHISALRKALGDTKASSRYIANVPGRGYEFIAPVGQRTLPAQSTATGVAIVSAFASATQRGGSAIYGREAALRSLSDQLARSRLLTIAGPGGIGKSTVARVLIEQAAADVVWVDLAELSTGELISTEVASKLEILSRTDDIHAEVAAAIEGHDVIIVLDSCEHVVDEAAVFVEAILGVTTTPRFVATSREPLRASGEWVHRLEPLALPAGCISAADASKSAAVQLFVERAAAARGGYELIDEDSTHVADICRQLDGIALAIELAAARMDTMSAKGVLTSLNDRFRLLTRGRRTALLRHQTLRATLDWSYMVLSDEEQLALQRLSIFRGAFTRAATAALLDGSDPDGLLDNLVSKSLIAIDPGSDGQRFRLLDTTRLYAFEKLSGSGADAIVFKRLAGFLSGLLEGNEQTLYSTVTEDWPEDFSHHVPSLRMALDWAFEPGGDALAGVRLSVAALPLFFRFSLLDECFIFVTKAIAYLDHHPELDKRSRMKLYAALGWPQMRATDGPQKGIDAWSTALRIAEDIGDIDYQLRALWALWVDAINRAEPLLGLDLARRFQDRAAVSPEPVDAVVGKRIMGATLHWLGRHEEARDLLEIMIEEYDALSPTTRFQFDQTATAKTILARCHWALGEAELALRIVEETVDSMMSIGHELSLTNVLAEAACPIALLEGRVELAAKYIALLGEHTKSLSLDGRAEDCLAALCPSMAVLEKAGFTLFKSAFQALEAEALSSLRKFAEAHRVIDAALHDGQRSGERWCRPELLRVKARLILDEGGPGAIPAANQFFQAGLELARSEKAVGWARRISADLSRFPVEPVSGGTQVREGASDQRRSVVQ
jgi:predicted ATPase/DNA-binding winged helix-turn-helix (wHTH) protein